MLQRTQPMTLIKRTLTGKDDRGNDACSEQQFPFQGVFAPVSSAEYQVGVENLTATTPTVYIAPDSGLADSVLPDELDVIEFAGQRYEINGKPLPWGGLSPFSDWNPGVEVHLHQAEGSPDG